MNIIKYVSDLLFPPKCIFCGKILPPETRPFICRECMENIPYIDIRCSKCGGTFNYINNNPYCATCKISGRYYDGAVSAAKYDNNMRQAILKYKYSYQSYMAKSLSYFLVNLLLRIGILPENIDFVISVPCDTERENRRGFDHAGLIAKNVAGSLKIPYRRNIIKKIKSTKPQSGMGTSKRTENVRGAYKIFNINKVRNKRILLIDDIFTTGATAMEVSKVLKRAGAAYVFIATVAKTDNKF